MYVNSSFGEFVTQTSLVGVKPSLTILNESTNTQHAHDCQQMAANIEYPVSLLQSYTHLQSVQQLGQ